MSRDIWQKVIYFLFLQHCRLHQDYRPGDEGDDEMDLEEIPGQQQQLQQQGGGGCQLHQHRQQLQHQVVSPPPPPDSREVIYEAPNLFPGEDPTVAKHLPPEHEHHYNYYNYNNTNYSTGGSSSQHHKLDSDQCHFFKKSGVCTRVNDS